MQRPRPVLLEMVPPHSALLLVLLPLAQVAVNEENRA